MLRNVNDYRGKVRSQISDNMDIWKAEVGRVREEKRRTKDQRRERVRRKKMQARKKVEKVAQRFFYPFFQCFVAPDDRKVGALKPRVRSHLVRWEMKKLHVAVARRTFRSPNAKNTSTSEHFWKLWCRKSAHRCGATFWSWAVEKVHAVVARTTCPSQNVQDTPGSEHFWKLRCWKSAPPSGAKHISKSKV